MRPLLRRVDSAFVRRTREALSLSPHAFARTLRVKERTLLLWESGRRTPNQHASTLIRLLRAYPDTLQRLGSVRPSPERQHSQR